MSGDRWLDLLALGILCGVAVTGLARTLLLASRGVWVLPIDRQRSLPQALLDLTFVLVALVFAYQTAAAVIAPESRLVAGRLSSLALPAALRWFGLLLGIAGLVLYVRALLDFGASWRFTIDRERPGPLVTGGVFDACRNPVYVALMLVALGVALVLADGLLLLMACAAPGYFHPLVRREERFLLARYGEDYAEYCARVPRWLPWP
jgi:protein-S-isoprenylcysteine O-methyltransferase Ste14